MGLTNDPRELTNELDPVLDRPMSGELTNELGNPVTNDPGTDQRPGNCFTGRLRDYYKESEF